MGCHFLLQRIFLTQKSNPDFLHCRQILYWLSYKGSYAFKTVCPNLEGVVRSSIVTFQRGHDQLMDIILIGWLWGKWNSGSPTILLVHLLGSTFLWGSIQLTSPTWRGFQYLQNNSKRLLLYSLRGNQGTAPRQIYFSFDSSYLFSTFSPFPS